MDFPEIISLGAAWQPVSTWLIALDFEWVGWSRFGRSSLDFDDEIPAVGIVDQTQELNWKDVWQIKLGIEYQFTNSLAIRGGYAYVDSPIPDETLSPANPDAAQHNFSLGCGYRPNRWTIDAFYTAGFYEDRSVENDVLDGTYENFTHYVGMSVGYRF